MAGFRFSLLLLSALVFAQIGRTQTPALPTPLLAENAVNKVYSLADLGDDPNLCKWIADTIPQMIKPGCWNGQNLCYYAPAKVMAIHQTPEVHAQVEEFLANLRKTLPRDKAVASRPKHDSQVMPAQFNPELTQPVGPQSASQAYPVPAALKAPKHLFHFIIRYEGAGIIDSNVTKFAQALTSAAGISSSNSQTMEAAMPSASPLMPATYHEGNVPVFPAPVNVPRTMPPADAPLSTPTPSSRASELPQSSFSPPPPPPAFLKF